MLVPTEFPDRIVCVMGLGYVGLTLAVSMAEAGFGVVGVEVREDIVEKLRRGEAHFFEPRLEQKLRQVLATGALAVETRIPGGSQASAYLITVGTPLGEDGRARIDMIENVAREVGASVKENDMVVLRSTVKVGATRNTVAPILDAYEIPYDLAYCPERTLEGRALEEIRTLPQIVGGRDMASNVRASQLFQFLTPTVVRVRDLETAEMIKLVDNTLRDVQFAFSNEVAMLCDAVGISAMEVVNAGKRGYPRTNLYRPGPVGGPCLEKDPYILAEAMRELGVEPEIAMAARALNENQPSDSVAFIKSTADRVPDFPDEPVLSLLGIAFKGQPATNDLRGTMARPIFESLKTAFPRGVFRGYDSMVEDQDIGDFGLVPTPSIEAAFDGADIVVVANNHPEFAAMPIANLAGRMATSGLVYDFWNNFDARDLTLPNSSAYYSLGGHGITNTATPRT